MVSYPIPVKSDSQFPLQNIPFGIFSTNDGRRRAGTIVGDYVVDLEVLERSGLFRSTICSFASDVFSQDTLNKFASLPVDERRQMRETIMSLLSNKDSEVFNNAELNDLTFIDFKTVEMHLPMSTTEFTDFSAADEHVRNCMAMTGLKLTPDNNFYFSPMAYTGRCSSITPSPTQLHRPKGVFRTSPTELPQYQPTQKLDYELEIGFFVSNPVARGTVVSPDEAEAHIFGFVLINDWSARDVQFYESIPIGPLNGKAFGTTISPWVIMPEALAYARSDAASQSEHQNRFPSHLKHNSTKNKTYDVTCHAFLQRNGTQGMKKVSTSNMKHMFYTPSQLLAHRSSSGCGMPTGELIGMGTVSSPANDWPDRAVERRGCLFEVTNDGKEEIRINEVGGTWLQDGDQVNFEAWANGKDGTMIGFGTVNGVVLPSKRDKMLSNGVE